MVITAKKMRKQYIKTALKRVEEYPNVKEIINTIATDSFSNEPAGSILYKEPLNKYEVRLLEILGYRVHYMGPLTGREISAFRTR